MADLSIAIKFPPRRKYLLAMLEGLIAMNRLWLRERGEGVGGKKVSLYERGIRYQREERDPLTGKSKEEWRTLDELMKYGVGDCEDLAAALVAEKRENGINAQPYLSRVGRMWHVKVRLPDGTFEDPSAKLGMRGPA